MAHIIVYYSSPAPLQIANVLGKLRETGWRPGRTLVLCSWDAEEFGLIGSTEWTQVCVCVFMLVLYMFVHFVYMCDVCVCVCACVRACMCVCDMCVYVCLYMP